jgi:hypothetical protein
MISTIARLARTESWIQCSWRAGSTVVPSLSLRAAQGHGA